jgi:hypothetical protein
MACPHPLAMAAPPPARRPRSLRGANLVRTNGSIASGRPIHGNLRRADRPGELVRLVRSAKAIDTPPFGDDTPAPTSKPDLGPGADDPRGRLCAPDRHPDRESPRGAGHPDSERPHRRRAERRLAEPAPPLRLAAGVQGQSGGRAREPARPCARRGATRGCAFRVGRALVPPGREDETAGGVRGDGRLCLCAPVPRGEAHSARPPRSAGAHHRRPVQPRAHLGLQADGEGHDPPE